jgi:hypothetical protein
MKIRKSKDVELSGINLLLYGNSGTGKTWYAGTAPKPLVLDFDGGIITLRNKDIAYIPREEMSTWKKALKVIDEAMESKEFETIVIDSFTVLSMICMEHVLKFNGVDTARIQDYGQQIRLLQGLIDTLTSNYPDKNLIVICHAEPVQDDFGKIDIRPLVVGKFSSRISLFFDEVYYATVEKKGMGSKAKETFILKTRKGSNYVAKSRLQLQAEIENDWSAFAKALKGGDATK